MEGSVKFFGWPLVGVGCQATKMAGFSMALLSCVTHEWRGCLEVTTSLAEEACIVRLAFPAVLRCAT